jgi:DNA-binding Xre family transcriptional regulator
MSRPAKHLPLGPLIEKILAERGMTKADFGRRINCSRQNVSLILKKEHLDTQLLWKICDVIDTDLFGLMSQTFGSGCNFDGSHRTGTMEIRLELSDTRLVQATADLVRGIMHKAQ